MKSYQTGKRKDDIDDVLDDVRDMLVGTTSRSAARDPDRDSLARLEVHLLPIRFLKSLHQRLHAHQLLPFLWSKFAKLKLKFFSRFHRERERVNPLGPKKTNQAA